MPAINTSAVDYGSRAAAMLNAMRYGTGNAGRVAFIIVGDSNQFITPSGAPATYAGGHWEGIQFALDRLFGTYAGSMVGNTAGGSWLNGNQSNVQTGGYFDGLTENVAGSPTYITDRTLPHASSGYKWSGTIAGVASGTTAPAATDTSSTNAAAVGKQSILGETLTGTGLTFAYSYMIPSTGSGKVRVGVRRTGTLTILASTEHTAHTSDVFADATLAVAADNNAANYEFQWNHIATASKRTEGPAYLGYVQAMDGTITTTSNGLTGAAVTPLYAAGGDSLIDLLGSLVFIERVALAEFMRQATKFADYVVVVNCFKGNDVSDTTKALLPDGSSSTSDSNTAAGWAQNIATFCEIVQSAWVTDLGKDLSKLLIIDWPYHIRPGYELQTTFEEQSATYAASGTYGSRLVVIRGSKLFGSGLTAAENEEIFLSQGWFNSSADRAHLSTPGYLGWNQLALETLVGAASPQLLGIPRKMTPVPIPL